MKRNKLEEKAFFSCLTHTDTDIDTPEFNNMGDICAAERTLLQLVATCTTNKRMSTRKKTSANVMRKTHSTADPLSATLSVSISAN